MSKLNKSYLSLSIALVCLIALSLWFYTRSSYFLVDNAQVKAELLTIRSEHSGKVTFSLKEYQQAAVKKGDAIVKLDTSLIEQDMAIVQAEIEEVKAKILYLQQQHKTELQLHNFKEQEFGIKDQRNQLKLAIREVSLKESKADLQRAEMLIQNKLIPDQDYQEYINQHEQRVLATKESRADLQLTDNDKKKLKVEREEIDLLALSIKQLQSKQQSMEARLASLAITKARYSNYSEKNGILDEVYVQPGEFVYEKQRLYTTHSPEDVYVEANIFESELTQVFVGKEVEVFVDAYPDRSFLGKIAHIGSLTSSQMSTLPSTKIVSNFIRIRQLIPLRIELLNTDNVLSPGLMAEVKISKIND